MVYGLMAGVLCIHEKANTASQYRLCVSASPKGIGCGCGYGMVMVFCKYLHVFKKGKLINKHRDKGKAGGDLRYGGLKIAKLPHFGVRKIGGRGSVHHFTVL